MSQIQGDQYSERAARVFTRINNIQNNVEDEKQSRFKLIESVLVNFEQNLNEISRSKQEKFLYLNEKVQIQKIKFFFKDTCTLKSIIRRNWKQIKIRFKTIQQFYKLETDLNQDLTILEKNGKRMIEQFQKERLESDERLVNSLSQQLEALSIDLQKEQQLKAESYNFLLPIMEEEIPKLKDDIANEINMRREVEQKIFDQFQEQIQELKYGFEDEKKLREQKEEELIQILQNITAKIRDQVFKSKKSRENTEEMMIKLVEQVIEKLRKDTLELDL